MQILVHKLVKFAQGILRVLDMITKITFPILLLNKLFFNSEALNNKTVLNLNFEIIFLKTIKHALNRLMHGAIQLLCEHNLIISKNLIYHRINELVF